MMAARIFSILSVLAVGVTAAPHDKRSIESGVTIYAYGTEISGLPIYSDADGLAVIVDADVANITDLGLASATWTIDTKGETAWDASTALGNGSFYIDSTGSMTQAGFAFNGTTPDDAETIGFLIYGSSVMFSTGSTYLSQFWAQNSSTPGVWALVWNTDGTAQDGSVPVLLKTAASTTVSTS